MSPMYGGIAGHTPAYVHALINVLYINGSSQFVDGSQQLADRLAEVIESCGGHVIAGDAVESVKVVDRVVESVMTKSKSNMLATGTSAMSILLHFCVDGRWGISPYLCESDKRDSQQLFGF